MENMEAKKEKLRKELDFSKTQKILIGSAVILSGLVGYKLGHRKCFNAVTNGIEVLWNTDPTLKEHMWKAIWEAKNRN